MPIKLIIFLAIGTFAMSIPLLILSRPYEIKRWKSFVATVLLTAAGTTGTYVMYYVENGAWGGLSFYGAVFLVPIIFLLVAPVLRLPYGKLMDMCAVGECVMLALMKVHCMIGGCCRGRVLFEMANGSVIRFPSRIVEMITALILFAVLLRWAMKNIRRGELYIWYLLLYGSTRFILNFLREAWQEWTGTIPMGTIWSVCAMIVAWMCFAVKKKRQQRIIEKT